MKFLIYAKLMLDERVKQMSGTNRDRGDAFGYVLITAVTVLIVAAVYKAVDAKVLQKIGEINGA